jgi:M6 family metalloprotease-like protein
MSLGLRKNLQRKASWAVRFGTGLLVLSTSLNSEALAVTACPNCTVDVVQPDGTILRLRPYGDEWSGRLVTEDGYTVVKGSDGWYYFATLAQNDSLVASDNKVLPASRRSIDNAQFLEITGKYLWKSVFENHPEVSESPTTFDSSLFHRGSQTTNNILLILIKYPDEANARSSADFNNLVNQNGFDGHGSMNQFYLENSYLAFGVTGTVVGWYTSSQNKLNYANTNGKVVAAQLVKEAVQAAVAAGVDFAPYDNNNDGFVDGLIVVHAGPGAEAGYADYPWSHKWSLSGAGVGAVTASGKTINSYIIVPEFTQPGNMSSIGVFCHEYGHQLGLPDLYDRTEPTAPSYGVGSWDIMGGGSWLGPGGDGSSPSHFSAWCKSRLGWITPINLTEYSLGVLLLNSESWGDCYRVWRSGVSGNEYFLLENRQKVGFDAFLPGCGIAIWHIDDSKLGHGNNDDVTHKLVDLEEADGKADLDNKTTKGDNGDLFPGGTYTSFSFSDFSNPDDYSYGGVPCALDVSSQNLVCSNTMYFDFNPTYGTKTISAWADLGGTISPCCAVFVLDGANQTFTITPDAGNQVDDVVVDGGSVGAVTSYTFTNVVQEHSIVAYFRCLPSYNPYLYRIDGDQLNHYSGYSVAGIGDINGDGKSEFIIGRRFSDAFPWVDCGSAIVYNGADAGIIYWYNGGASYDQFGYAVAGAGDVDGDGTPDFIIGAPFSSVGGPAGGGAVYVFSGRTGSRIRLIGGDQVNQYLGYSVAGVGNVTGDGKAEFIAGAPYGDAYGLVDCGLAIVYTASGGLYDWHYGEANGAHFGTSVAGVGDVNGDGRPDWIAGAPHASPNGISQAGSAYVYSATGALIYKLNGEQVNHWAGTSVAGIGDLTNDGRADFIVGRPGEDAYGLVDNGNIIVYSGINAGTYSWVTGEGNYDELGTSVAGLGDFNNDGRPDYVIGAPKARRSCDGAVTGAAYVYSGFNGVLLNKFNGSENYDNFGYSVAGAGDVNGDGGADIIVGAVLADPPGQPSNAGSTFIYVSTPGSGCKNRAGNVDCDPADGCDIADLSRLIDFLYISFSPLGCTEEANIDGQTGTDISDLSALIDYLYISFTPPAACQ